MDYKLLIDAFEQETDTARWPRQRVLHECLRWAIVGGKLAAGTRLLASRALAAELGLARNTVLYAYDQLATEGFLQPDRRGTVVSSMRPPGAGRASGQQLRVKLASRSQSLCAIGAAGTIQTGFAPGVPALDQFPLTLWRRLLDRAWKSLDADQLNYGDAAGEPALRIAIADHLAAARGVRCDAGQVFITGGTQHSLDICARAFADAGANAWIENPGYMGALAAFRGAQLRTVGIATDTAGINPQPRDWTRDPPRLIYTSPSHQYPTGCVLSLQRRLSLIGQARRAGALIIEDDYDSEFRHDGPPLSAMQGLTDDAPVLYLGTFSKTMFPALRIGYVVAPAAAAGPLRALLSRTAPQGRVAEQLALADFLRNGQFALHVRRMRRLYRQRRDATVAALEKHLGGVATVHGESAGMHLALRLHDARIDDTRIAARALEQGVAAQALSAHSTGARAHGWNGFLLGYSQVPAEQAEGLVKRLAALVRAG